MEIPTEKQPHSESAEIAVLSSIMWDNKSINRLDGIINTNDFYIKRHQVIYDCMLKLHKEKRGLGLIFLQEELNSRNQLDEIGGVKYLSEIFDDTPNVALIEKHAQFIKDKSLMREFILIQLNNITYCQNIGTRSSDDLFNHLERSTLEFIKKRQTSDGHQLNFLMVKTFLEINSIKPNENGVIGVPTGFSELDRITSGLKKSQVIILGARPAMGKTSFALNVAVNAAKQGYSVGILSLEMASTELCIRILASESEINQQLISTKSGGTEDYLKIIKSAQDLNNLKIFIDDNGSLNILQIRSKARAFKAEYNIDLLIIDYLQLISSVRRTESKYEQVSEISKSLKALAKELEIPILCLSQLSRSADDRNSRNRNESNDQRPKLNHLRDSGSIEADADVVLFIYRDIVYNKLADPNGAELIIAKNRNGKTTELNINFNGELTKFYE